VPGVIPLVRVDGAGPAAPRPLGVGTAGTASISASNMVLSLTLAAVTATVSGGRPLPSKTRWSLPKRLTTGQDQHLGAVVDAQASASSPLRTCVNRWVARSVGPLKRQRLRRPRHVLFVQGPRDNPAAILETLEGAIDRDNSHPWSARSRQRSAQQPGHGREGFDSRRASRPRGRPSWPDTTGGAMTSRIG
jgi:hypothetical protein